MYCSNCGTKIENGNFCPVCGQKTAGNTNNTFIPEQAKPVRKKNILLPLICIIAAAAVVLTAVGIHIWRGSGIKSAMNETTTFKFFEYDFSIPTVFSYDEGLSNEAYAVFQTDTDASKRIDFVYGGSGYSAGSAEPSDILDNLYDIYGIADAGVLNAEECSSVAGMYTICGRVLTTTDTGIWNVYACINDDSELFYFILMDDSDDYKELFEDMIYETEKSL